jgi:hypothetical protein
MTWKEVLFAYRDINLVIQYVDDIKGFTAGGKFPRGLDLIHLQQMYEETAEITDKNRTVLSYDKDIASDLLHHYNEKECVWLGEKGHFLFIGFKKFERIIDVVEELRYFIDLQ